MMDYFFPWHATLAQAQGGEQEVLRCILFLWAALLGLGAPAHAEPLVFRFCSIDVDVAPVARLDGSGHYQYLIVQAARKLGIKLERRIAPRRRCLEELRNGSSDGMVAAYARERATFAEFPMVGGGADVSKALGAMRYYAYRRRGGDVEWDGRQFVGLSGKVGVESAFVFVTDRLNELEVPYDDGAKTLEQNLNKLLAARVDAVIGMDLEASKVIAERLPGRVERAGKPFDVTPMYLMLSRQFRADQPQLAQRLWDTLEELRNSPEYRRYQEAHP
jgi:polar amino acid transport system substrate-binding protein